MSSPFLSRHKKKLLCGPQPTHVATTASCWSSAYPCSYHNFPLVRSGSVKPKSPLLWSSQPTPVTNKETRWSSDYSCIIIALCLSLVYHSFHKKPHLWCSANRLATTSSLVVLRPQKASLVVLSLPPKSPQHPGCLQLTRVVTTTLCLSTDKPVSH